MLVFCYANPYVDRVSLDFCILFRRYSNQIVQESLQWIFFFSFGLRLSMTILHCIQICSVPPDAITV